MTETITLNGTSTDRWIKFETIDSISKGAKSFSCLLENSDRVITNYYESYDAAVIVIDGVTVFNGRIEEVIPNESDGDLELSGRDYLGDLIGEYIIEEYGLSQDVSGSLSAGSSVTVLISNTTEFEVGDEVKLEDANDAETATIESVVTNTSIVLDELSKSYTDPTVTVGRLGSYIVNDLVTKYGSAMTRTGIQASTNKFIILFKGVTAFDAIQYIADAEEYEFGQNESKDFFYHSQAFEHSGLTIDLDTSDVIDYKFPRPGYEIVNRVDVYGATVGGVQVAVRSEDPDSQNYYGTIKGHTIIDEKIITESQAVNKANTILAEKAWVIQTGELNLLGYETLKAGQLITLTNFDSVPDGQYLVTEKRHTYLPGTTFISVAEYRTELEDVIVDLLKRMREREKEAIDENALQTKFLNFYITSQHEDLLVDVIRVDINSTFIVSHKTNGLLGRGHNGVDSNPLKLGRYQTETVIL